MRKVYYAITIAKAELFYGYVFIDSLKFTRWLMHTAMEKLVKIYNRFAARIKPNTVALKRNLIVIVIIIVIVFVWMLLDAVIVLHYYYYAHLFTGEPLNELSKFSHAKYNTNVSSLSLLIHNKCLFTQIYTYSLERTVTE